MSAACPARETHGRTQEIQIQGADRQESRREAQFQIGQDYQGEFQGRQAQGRTHETQTA
jgi:hypothetical protein